tara:strand:+ start:3278 stop:3877 length:600 start_codon:yes stop_codon:yes gene_type:complete
MCITFGQNEVIKKRIVIDAGHGGIDPGAIGINGIQEKDVVLNISKTILRLNKSVLASSFDIYLTRYTDTLISLSDRSRLAKALEADVFVSLHCNASKRMSRGMEVYVNRSDNANTEASIALGISVLNEGTQKLGFKKRGVKLANFQVLRETIAFCPAVLVEVGFVTHVDEARYFSKLENIRAIALAILLGIDNYLNNAL